LSAITADNAAAAPAQPPLRGISLAFVTLALSLGAFIEVLDVTVANVAVPTIAGSLGVSNNEGTWVISSYSVAGAIIVPLTGWLAQRVGEVRLFMLSVLLFTLSSLGCGLSPSFHALVFMRIVQGLVSGPMGSLSQTILVRSFPPSQRNVAIALWAMTLVIAPILGPVVGGWIIGRYSWPWIFFINLPIGLFSFFCCAIFLRGRETKVSKPPIDMIGIGLIVVGVGALQLMLDLGHDKAWFESSFIVMLGIVAFVALGFTLIWELTDRHPVLDLDLFRERTFASCTVVGCLGTMVFSTVAVIFPLWLQTMMGYTAEQAGLATAPVGLFTLLFSLVIAKSMKFIDLRLLASFGFCVLAGVLFWNSHFDLDMSFGQVILPRFVQGIGVAFFFIPLTTATLSRIPNDRLAAASSLSNFLRNLFGAFGTAISVTMWDSRATYHHAILAEAVNRGSVGARHYLDVLHAAGMTGGKDLSLINDVVTKQSYMIATNEVFYASGALCLVLAVIIWFARPKASGGLDLVS
jgi:MFS transporter, DHA2 family, multidrug resistance protein